MLPVVSDPETPHVGRAVSGSDIVLVALNARWSHASFGLRCLKANLGPLRDRCTLLERTIDDRAADVVEAIFALSPRVVGLSVYIWNATEMLAVAKLLRALRPDIVVVMGGPEVSHETDEQELTTLAHHVVVGEGEDAFRELCLVLLRDKPGLHMLPEKIIKGGSPDLEKMPSPYPLYDDVDLKDRVVYVEASRGCPFTCEFCLSSLDEKVRAFPLEPFLAEMQTLMDRGLNTFKFIDRTFNLKIDITEKIITFFLERMRPGLFVHFEMVPDRLPPSLRALLVQFPPGAVQLEVGIQTFDAEVGRRIRRKQNVPALEDNLRFLRRETGAHIHADLIVGLPGEDLGTFAKGFDRLVALDPNEIQVGILKRLRGAPIAKHTDEHQMVYGTTPPYEVLQTSTLSFADLQRMKRFARFFDLVKNSGRLLRTAKLLLAGDSAFVSFLAFSDWLYAETGARHGISAARLAELCTRYLIDVVDVDRAALEAALVADLGEDRALSLLSPTVATPKTAKPKGIPARQARHLA
ncbi:MAG TPA: DUF4080 domain-containing protein [Myxococcota bacterium]